MPPRNGGIHHHGSAQLLGLTLLIRSACGQVPQLLAADPQRDTEFEVNEKARRSGPLIPILNLELSGFSSQPAEYPKPGTKQPDCGGDGNDSVLGEQIEANGIANFPICAIKIDRDRVWRGRNV
jgi:hypothetical protein